MSCNACTRRSFFEGDPFSGDFEGRAGGGDGRLEPLAGFGVEEGADEEGVGTIGDADVLYNTFGSLGVDLKPDFEVGFEVGSTGDRFKGGFLGSIFDSAGDVFPFLFF